MRLYYSAPSPFAAKVRMAASHCGIAVETVPVDTTAEPDQLLKANPLGKIPVLVMDDGATVYDSRVICALFDRMSGNQMVPQAIEPWRIAATVEATADGIVDALILSVYEVRYRPEDKRHQPWVDKQLRKADRGLASLEQQILELPEDLTIGHFAVAALLGWATMRFPGKIEGERPQLAAWLQRFEQQFPAYADLKPSMPAS